ncbi:MAG: lytic transglycosylase domain-containing protein [Bacteriovoracaceae bacterium]|nr:lytic transglycosylase domain-containing protein [Bacteriovoracaceae bacterium]
MKGNNLLLHSFSESRTGVFGGKLDSSLLLLLSLIMLLVCIQHFVLDFSINIASTIHKNQIVAGKVQKKETKKKVVKKVIKKKLIKKQVAISRTYQFAGVGQSFGAINLKKFEGISKEALHLAILKVIPSSIRKKAKKFIPIALEYSQQYQVDPFWILSVMWTESHFNHRARSYARAQGLMQIMPRTGRFLARLMKKGRTFKQARALIRDPEKNVEMGVYYLKRLLKQFKYNYRYATVAYNMGPGWVSKRLRRGRGVGVRNQYLNKVIRVYRYFKKTNVPEILPKLRSDKLKYVAKI